MCHDIANGKELFTPLDNNDGITIKNQETLFDDVTAQTIMSDNLQRQTDEQRPVNRILLNQADAHLLSPQPPPPPPPSSNGEEGGREEQEEEEEGQVPLDPGPKYFKLADPLMYDREHDKFEDFKEKVLLKLKGNCHLSNRKPSK